MSDDEEVMHSYEDYNTLGTIEEEEASEEEEEETNSEDESEDEQPKNQAPEEDEEEERPSGPSEAEIAAQSRPNQFLNCGIDDETLALLELARKEREKQEEEIRVLRLKRKRRAMDNLKSVKGLDEHDQEMLAANQVERDIMAKEIAEMKKRSDQRKKEREEEERRLQKQRAEEDARRKSEEEDRKRKKEEEEQKRKEERAQKMAEFEKWKNPQTPNFVITKKAGGGPKVEDDEEKAARRRARLAKAGSKKEVKEEEDSGAGGEKKSREQLEAEKQAILAQRIQPLNVDGADMSKLTDKAKELQSLIMRLESEKYDLEKRFKNQQIDMMELAERARQMNKVGRGGQIKRLQLEDDEMQQKFAGCPSKIVMYSEYERQKDPRGYGDRKVLFKGPVYGFPAERVQPTRVIKWNDQTGLPEYEDLPGAPPREDAEEE